MNLDAKSERLLAPEEYTILIVDDSPQNLRVIESYLRKQGFNTLIASRGELALKRIQYAHPDLILLDVMLPGIDGFETCRRLKANETTKDIPVIFITALTETAHKIEGFNVGGVDYITKPFQVEEVLARVQTHLNLFKLQHQLEKQNENLKYAIKERKYAQSELKKSYDELEQRVEERTAELKREIKERKQAEESLRESENHLRHLSSQLLTAQENERKRIALELHDGIGQGLSALKFGVENSLKQMDKGTARPIIKPLEAVIPIIQESIEEVRKIAMDLRPATLDDLGILATIGWFCREFQTIYGGIRIEKQINIEENEVPELQRTVIYRVMQEAMNNITKHSKADLVRLSLRKTDSVIELVVEDNGLGFDLEDALSLEISGKGIGLSSMKERVELFGGSFQIRAAKGEGTRLEASWPYR